MLVGQPQTIKRRQFLKSAAFCAVGTIAKPMAALGATQPTRSLSLAQLNTQERLDVTYIQNGRYDAQALEQLDHFMRDWRTGDIIPIDRNLYDLLYLLTQQLPCKGPIGIVSAYRSHQTNEMLRRRGRGAAKNSLHTFGMAVDFRLTGVKLSNVRKSALSLNAGGVGYYPKSQFIHMDTGPVRYWQRP